MKVVKIEGDVNEVNKLTGIPNEKDQILFLVPMVAPYSSIQNCTYKVKIVPGSMKKGKSIDNK